MKCLNKMFEKQYYYTFDEIVGYYYDPSPTRFGGPIPYDDDDFANFNSFLDTTKGYWNKNNTRQELFIRLYRRFYNHYVYYMNEVLTAEQLADNDDWNGKMVEFRTNLANILENTADRYEALIGLYNSEKTRLLDGVKTITTGTGRFNDTPQDITNGDEFGNNTHITNITKSTAEAVSDLDTKMGRIDEIQRKLRNLWKDWLDEFESVFIERGNI